MSREETNIMRYAIAVVSEFADHFRLSQHQAFNYLHRFKGIDYLLQYYDVLHTLSFDDAVQSLAAVCEKNGGRLS
ncbi:MAG: DUF3791 domain-containing protein [Bacteroidales bacterium]|nr:DUF3791 domain-containing protein [Bacteroidales bacterium]